MAIDSNYVYGFKKKMRTLADEKTITKPWLEEPVFRGFFEMHVASENELKMSKSKIADFILKEERNYNIMRKHTSISRGSVKKITRRGPIHIFATGYGYSADLSHIFLKMSVKSFFWPIYL